MPIFEERESLGVKTLKSFADIKKELVMFVIVKHGRSPRKPQHSEITIS